MSPVEHAAEAYPDLIAEIASTSPGRICLEEVDGPVRTYAEVHANGRAWQQALTGLGLSPGETVLTFVASSVVSVELWCGIAFAGAIEASANPAYRGALLDHIIADTRARIAVVDDRYLAGLRAGLIQAPNIEYVLVVGGGSEVNSEGPTHIVSADALLGATGGTTPGDVSRVPIPGHATACILYLRNHRLVERCRRAFRAAEGGGFRSVPALPSDRAGRNLPPVPALPHHLSRQPDHGSAGAWAGGAARAVLDQ